MIGKPSYFFDKSKDSYRDWPNGDSPVLGGQLRGVSEEWESDHGDRWRYGQRCHVVENKSDDAWNSESGPLDHSRSFQTRLFLSYDFAHLSRWLNANAKGDFPHIFRKTMTPNKSPKIFGVFRNRTQVLSATSWLCKPIDPQPWPYNKVDSELGSGCGSVSKAVASDTGDPRFDSRHRHNFV